MEHSSPTQWCDERKVAKPDTNLDKLLVQTFWVRMMKSVIPVPELDSVLGIRASSAFLYCGPAGTGKHTLARALAGSLSCDYYQMSGRDLNEDMESRLETLLRQVDPDHPLVLQCENLQSCGDPDALAACLSQMIQVCDQANLPVVFILIEEEDKAIPAALLRQLTVCRFVLPNLLEREEFFSKSLSKRFPLQPGLGAKDLAVASDGLNLRQLSVSLRMMLRGLKEQALVRYKTRYSMAQDAIRNMELVVDMNMFREIVNHLKEPEKEKQPPIQIVQTVAAASTGAVPVEQDQPESKTDRLKQSKSMSDFFNNL